jgi:hypothetical protein
MLIKVLIFAIAIGLTVCNDQITNEKNMNDINDMIKTLEKKCSISNSSVIREINSLIFTYNKTSRELYDEILIKLKKNNIHYKVNNVTIDVTLVGRFLVLHKFYDIDRRMNCTNAKNENILGMLNYTNRPYFLASFPNPPILNEHSILAQVCKRDFFICIKSIEHMARYLEEQKLNSINYLI